MVFIPRSLPIFYNGKIINTHWLPCKSSHTWNNPKNCTRRIFTACRSDLDNSWQYCKILCETVLSQLLNHVGFFNLSTYRFLLLCFFNCMSTKHKLVIASFYAQRIRGLPKVTSLQHTNEKGILAAEIRVVVRWPKLKPIAKLASIPCLQTNRHTSHHGGLMVNGFESPSPDFFSGITIISYHSTLYPRKCLGIVAHYLIEADYNIETNYQFRPPHSQLF